MPQRRGGGLVDQARERPQARPRAWSPPAAPRRSRRERSPPPRPHARPKTPARPPPAGLITHAESASGVKRRPPRLYTASVPILRLKRATVSCGCVTSRSWAIRPTTARPSLSTLTTLGIRNSPNWLGTSYARPSLYTATRLLVVPRSMPTIAICAPCNRRRTDRADCTKGRAQPDSLRRGPAVRRGFSACAEALRRRAAVPGVRRGHPEPSPSLAF